MFKNISYSQKVNLFSLLLCAALVAFIFREYSRAILQQEQIILTQFNDIQSDLTLEAKIITKFVSGGRIYAENYFKFSQNDMSPWYSLLKYDEKYKGSYLQNVSEAYRAQKIGNLTTTSDSYRRDPIKKREINMALRLGEYFSPGLMNINKSPWFYYTSSDFIYLAPYAPASEFFFDPLKTTAKEFYKNAGPENNPLRHGFWTHVYFDEAGYGLMVTYSEPVYEGDVFKGAVSLDVTLDQFNEVLQQRPYIEGTFALFNRQNQLLAGLNSVTSKDPHITMADEKIPSELTTLATSMAKTQSSPQRLQRLKSNYVFFRDFPEFDSTLVFFIPVQQMVMIILKNMMTLNLTFLLCFILIVKLRQVILNDYRLQQNLIQNAKMAALGQMASGMAHEINNPLAIIKGKSALMLKALDSSALPTIESLRTDILKILNTSERIEKIIRGLKSFSRNSDNDPLQSTSLKSLILNTLELCRESIVHRNVTLRVENIPDVQLTARESQLAQVLLNLLNNAMDAVQGSEHKEISLAFEMKKNRMLIFVRDTGPKISADVQARLMEPFFTTKNPGDGTGLGLSISLGIMQQHNGQLYFQPGDAFTCFVMEIPVSGVNSNSASGPKT